MKLKMRWSFLLLAVPLSAWAIEPGPASRSQQETENWLQIQVSGKARSPVPQVATPQEREQSFQRWLDSYKHPIPEYYKQDEGGNTASN